jgi:glutamate synthase domain-containing protein 3
MVQIDASRLSLRDINTQIRAAAEHESEIELLNPDARHNLAVGLTRAVNLTIRGSAGYFCVGLCDGPTVDVEGNVGWGFGDNLMNGLLRVEGNAGAVCGVAMRSGHILVRGNAGNRIGQVMKGGSIVIGGEAGYRAGSMMMGGTIVVLGGASEALGEFIMDGEIFVTGPIVSLGQDAVAVDAQDGDAQKVAQILARHGLEHDGPFQKVISDQRALRYAEYEKGELLFDEAREQKAETVTADGNRDVMTFDAD